jgi:hypothetical protein
MAVETHEHLVVGKVLPPHQMLYGVDNVLAVYAFCRTEDEFTLSSCKRAEEADVAEETPAHPAEEGQKDFCVDKTKVGHQRGEVEEAELFGGEGVAPGEGVWDGESVCVQVPPRRWFTWLLLE